MKKAIIKSLEVLCDGCGGCMQTTATSFSVGFNHTENPSLYGKIMDIIREIPECKIEVHRTKWCTNVEIKFGGE